MFKDRTSLKSREAHSVPSFHVLCRSGLCLFVRSERDEVKKEVREEVERKKESGKLSKRRIRLVLLSSNQQRSTVIVRSYIQHRLRR